MLADDGDAVFQPHDVLHTSDRTGRRVIDRGNPAAICRTRGDASDHHAGNADIDAELHRPIDFLRRVETAQRFAEQAEIRGAFEIDLGGNRLLRGGLGQFAIGGRTAARRVVRDTSLDREGCRLDIPFLRRRPDQHRSGNRAGLAQQQPVRARTGRPASRLLAQKRRRVELVVRRRVLEDNLVEPQIQFLGDQRGLGGIDPLTHLHIGNDETHGSGSVDTNEPVRRKSRGPVSGGGRLIAGLRNGRNRSPGWAHAPNKEKTEGKIARATQNRAAARRGVL